MTVLRDAEKDGHENAEHEQYGPNCTAFAGHKIAGHDSGGHKTSAEAADV